MTELKTRTLNSETAPENGLILIWPGFGGLKTTRGHCPAAFFSLSLAALRSWGLRSPPGASPLVPFAPTLPGVGLDDVGAAASAAGGGDSPPQPISERLTPNTIAHPSGLLMKLVPLSMIRLISRNRVASRQRNHENQPVLKFLFDPHGEIIKVVAIRPGRGRAQCCARTPRGSTSSRHIKKNATSHQKVQVVSAALKFKPTELNTTTRSQSMS
jgi:hypothetical protein